MAQLPSAACMPPWAAEECDRLAGTMDSTDDVEAGQRRSTAMRSPERPAPMTRRSEKKVCMPSPF
jgi:hypothetical protein